MSGQSVKNDNTIVVNNFCFKYVKLINITQRMSYKLKWLKNTLGDIWNTSCFKLYMNDTNLTHSTNELNKLELFHSQIIHYLMYFSLIPIMLYYTSDYWVFVYFVNHLVFQIEHILETATVSILNKKKNCWGTAAVLGLREGANLNLSSAEINS
jgi:hypothetical protein